ncbi:MAG TPA: zinc ribbon domain-containing protein [Blastocatellia bacterium]|jgi:putative FmdB family regulatory protein
MPIYEYVCEKCGDHLEVIQKLGDEPLKRCKKCRGKLEKIISRTSFQLKGSGWYASDYAKSQKSESKSDGAKSDAKSDSKTKSNDTATAD